MDVRSPPLPKPLVGALLAVALSWAWYVHHWPGFHAANEAMRLYFVQAVVETGRPELDPIVKRHGSTPVDRSEKDGHVYMDKAPGTSLLALPLYPVLKAAHPPVQREDLWIFGYLATLVAVALPLWGMLVGLAKYLLSLGMSARVAGATTLALGLASPVLVYASLLFGHGLAAACVAGGWLLLAARPADQVGAGRAFLAGNLLGYGGFTDTPVFLLAAGVCLYPALRARPVGLPGAEPPVLDLPSRFRAMAPVVAGVAVWAVAQLAYNAWVLGHPLQFTYQFKGDRDLKAIMDTGFLGFRLPQGDALVGLWLGSQRGLLYHAPWLAAALGGLGLAVARRDLPERTRLDAAWLLLLTVGYALLVAGFADWPAGDCVGARHLLPIVPLLAVGLAHVWTWPKLNALGRALLTAAIVAGVLMHLPSVATFPYHFHQMPRPVLELGWPLVVQGHFSPSLGRFVGIPDDWAFALFVALVALPWLLLDRLPRGEATGRRWVHVGLVTAVLVVWATGLAASTPRPGRTTEVARYKASALLGSGGKVTWKVPRKVH